jgi:uncharacterized protein (TIGR00303 family)
MFILFIGATELSEIPGLSAAGADTDVLPYTAPADADMLFYDRPKVMSSPPIDPFGHPSPAVVTRAAIIEGRFPVMAVNVGSSVEPKSPFVHFSSVPSKDPRFGPAVEDSDRIERLSAALARKHSAGKSRMVIAESVPGGTTTALLLLRALGYSGTVSSAGPDNPLSLKESIWEAASRRLNIGVGGLRGEGLAAAAEVGDAMQIAVASFVAALPEEVEVVLAGGCQMMAVAALIRDMGISRPMLVATTKYVANDRTSCFFDYGKQIGVDTYAAPLDFSKSRFKGLAEYEKGFIKEGVGMGGAVWYALKNGATIEMITSRAEDIYSHFTE